MNFDFSDDQKSLKDEARRFLSEKAGAKVTRRVLNDDKLSYDDGLWRAAERDTDAPETPRRKSK